MFLVVPKSKANIAAPAPLPHAPACVDPGIQPLATATRGARVRIACDRCRIKKVKCDGDTPCLRCFQDSAPCIATKKAHTDAKGMMREYVHSIESQQTHLVRALQKAYRHSRQSIDHEDMKEIVEIVRRCGYEFEEVPETPNKPQTAARMHESSTCSTVDGDASKGINLDALHGAQNFTQTTSDDRTYSVPQKRRKRELEPDADMTFVSSATDSVVGVEMYGRSLDGQSQLQMVSSAQMVTTAPSAQNTNHIDPQAIGAEVSNLGGQSKQIGPWPDIDSGLSRKLTSPDTSSNTFHEPDVSSVVTPNAWLPAPSPTEFDTQLTDLNHTDLSLTPFPAASDNFDLQAMFDMDSIVWWDPSSLYDASIGNIGHVDSAS